MVIPQKWPWFSFMQAKVILIWENLEVVMGFALFLWKKSVSIIYLTNPFHALFSP
jgi:hypothetical protein